MLPSGRGFVGRQEWSAACKTLLRCPYCSLRAATSSDCTQEDQSNTICMSLWRSRSLVPLTECLISLMCSVLSHSGCHGTNLCQL